MAGFGDTLSGFFDSIGGFVDRAAPLLAQKYEFDQKRKSLDIERLAIEQSIARRLSEVPTPVGVIAGDVTPNPVGGWGVQTGAGGITPLGFALGGFVLLMAGGVAYSILRR